MQPVHLTPIPEKEDDEIDLLGLLGTVIDHKWLIAGVTGAFLLAGAAYAILATPVYQATALIQVEAKKNDMLGFSDVSSMLGKESPSVTEIELIKSRAIIGKTVDSLHLDVIAKPKRFPFVGNYVARKFEEKNPGSISSAWLGLNSYAWGGEAIDIYVFEIPEVLKGTKLTLVSGENGSYSIYDGDNQEIVKSKVGELFQTENIKVQLKSLTANPGTKFRIEQRQRLTRIGDYQESLNITERGKDSGIISLSLEDSDPVLASTTLNEIVNLYVRQNVERTSAEAAQSLDFLREQLPQVRKDLEKAENALNAYQTRSKSIDISLETKAILDQIVSLDTSISELKLQQAEMDRKFTPQHPAYRALLTQMGELASKQAGLSKKVEGLPSTQQELLSLTRDVKVSTEIYTQLLNRSQELDVMRAGTVGNVRLIDSAEVDLSEPVKPKKAIIVAIATLMGLLIGVGIVLLRKALNRGVESAEEIEQLGLPVYASVPYSDLQKTAEDRRVRSASKNGNSTLLLATNHPTDLAIESLRSLRTSLHFGMMEATNNRLMISGPSPKVGKTFISSNLASVIAQSGQRVLLIDVDMRKGYLHKMLGIPVDNGLSDILSKRCTLENAIHKTEVENFDLIGRGPIPPNPSELLMHRNFTDFLDQVSKLYDLVILDTPPLLAVTDAAIVGRQCGTNLIVTRFGLNPVREIDLTIRRFAQNGISLRGAIFNGVEKRTANSYGYGGYGYYNYEYKSDNA
ncbi:polysaccharide biosynthesis tyrosine autokinase [Pseudomonas sp. B21-048]|uniref:polysaccharide biosynthesis tyrosine autokinase n=1 Tax=Pseudomonas sp. B21-048 TaxID=2895490 RepID=UPI00215FF06F|nr:polysaccharide biosynthesis tyrosine autokinase [Pseudomonas sp. B21-048]UVL00648.1 polysaccharide biosynthesis tyrosine autokinase [Pseudomonas sp. B21-048]